jgi:hypothetical protein
MPLKVPGADSRPDVATRQCWKCGRAKLDLCHFDNDRGDYCPELRNEAHNAMTIEFQAMKISEPCRRARRAEMPVCTICGAEAEYQIAEGIYRHKNAPFKDQSHLCPKYGYPIKVENAPVAAPVSAETLEEWICEDELPRDYPYHEMFPYSKLGPDGKGGVRIFPKVPRVSAETVMSPDQWFKANDKVVYHLHRSPGWMTFSDVAKYADYHTAHALEEERAQWRHLGQHCGDLDAIITEQESELAKLRAERDGVSSAMSTAIDYGERIKPEREGVETKWISAKERLPRVGEWAWVVCNGFVQRQASHLSIASDSEFEMVWYWAVSEAVAAPLKAVTHWAALPDPPKGEV